MTPNAATNLITAHANELAGVIVEPLQRLMPPHPGFLEALRDITRKLGIPLIFDEVVTGFRLAYGGAQEAYGVVPDICTLGKAIGGGFPLAAIAGRDDIMVHFDKDRVGDDKFLMQIGTLSGNPLPPQPASRPSKSCAAPAPTSAPRRPATPSCHAIRKSFRRDQHSVSGGRSLVDVRRCLHRLARVHDYRAIFHANKARLIRFNELLREKGILKSENKFYVSHAHDDEDVAQTISAIEYAANTMSRDA